MNEVTFAGLRFSEYFTLLFGIHTNASAGVVSTPYPTSILDAVDVAKKAHLSIEQFTKFADVRALTLAAARESFGALNESTFSGGITTSTWTSNQLVFRDRPLLQLPDGRFLVLDLQFLFESASAGLSWTLMEHLDKGERGLFLEYWGGIFEQYVQNLLGHYYPAQTPIDRSYSGGQIDGVLVVGGDVVVFEVKAGFLRQEVKGARDPALIDAALRKKYVIDSEGRRVGVRQLAATSTSILENRVTGLSTPGLIYPVLVGEDPILQTPGVNIYLNDIFREEITSDRVAPLTVMLVDELEQLLPHLTAGDITWQDVFSSRFIGTRVTGEPVHTTLVDLAIRRRFRRRADTFLAEQTERLTAMIKDAYAGLA